MGSGVPEMSVRPSNRIVTLRAKRSICQNPQWTSPNAAKQADTRTYVLVHCPSMYTPPATTVLTLEQITEMQRVLVAYRFEAAAAMYRTDNYERPYRAGRGEMYRLWNMLGQAIDLLETFKQEQFPAD